MADLTAFSVGVALSEDRLEECADLLIKALRSETPLRTDVRELLALLLEGRGPNRYGLHLKRGRGAPLRADWIDEAEAVLNRVAAGDPTESAVAYVAQERGKGRSTIFASLQKYREASEPSSVE